MSTGVERPARYVVEVSLRGGLSDVQSVSTRVRAAAERSEDLVRLLRAVYVPEEDACLLVFDAPTADAARAVTEAADLDVTGVDASIRASER